MQVNRGSRIDPDRTAGRTGRKGIQMQANGVLIHGGYQDLRGRRREDWLPNSLISGFAATFAMTVVILAAYWFARAVGDANGSRIEQWFYALHDNALTRSTEDAVVLAIGLNLIVGVAWALLYGYYGSPSLGGPGWLRGMVFALVPWLLSIVVFFPIMDASRTVRYSGRCMRSISKAGSTTPMSTCTPTVAPRTARRTDS
jgi:hypothetical protein